MIINEDKMCDIENVTQKKQSHNIEMGVVWGVTYFKSINIFGKIITAYDRN